MTPLAIIATIAACAVLLYARRTFWAGVAGAAGLVWILASSGSLAADAIAGLAAAFGLVFGILGFRPLRRALLTSWLMRVMAPLLPRMGETERIALEAGTVWWDRALFSGRLDWRKILSFDIPPLTPRERAFLEGPVEDLCRRLDDWQVHKTGDLPPEIWRSMKEQGFFGMIIPESYGGLGFSAQMHSAVVTRLSSRCLAAGVTVMVPNSLGPAELLLHYGTEEQKDHYLPRLARGEEIPCFALTGPEAGSDAAATQSVGIVCRGIHQGRETLMMRLNWSKRYITLSSVATVIGLAFRLKDPEGLLGGREDLGITCALIPTSLPGIEIGQRHDPMGVPFHNGPIRGRDVEVPLEFIVGGRAMAGQGWRMLMERLAAGRSISLPALSVAAAELSARVVGAYATVREQFDTPIGRFEGIEEPLARIGGLAYLMDAARRLTAGAVDSGESPAVLSAIVKAYLTESMRRVVNDAMDIRAGAGISRGPRNILARVYQALPIGITVEGANILTRSMIIYGQGAIRSHPFVQEEMKAVAAGDVRRFDRAFFGHAGAFFANATRAFMLALTGGRPAGRGTSRELRDLAGKISRMSAAFALTSDVAMATLGGKLKRREKISGRLADALAWMYLGTAALKRYEDEGRRPCDLPLARWACTHALHEVQKALAGTCDNLPNRIAGRLLRLAIFPLGASLRPPSDFQGALVARELLEDREARLRLTRDIHVPRPDEPGLGRLEAALDKAVGALAVETKIRDAVRAGRIGKAPGDALLDIALEAGVISAEEKAIVLEADEIRDEVIQVDAFAPDEFLALAG